MVSFPFNIDNPNSEIAILKSEYFYESNTTFISVSPLAACKT